MKELKNEKDLSTVKQTAKKSARFSCKNADKKWTCVDQSSPCQGSESTFCIDKQTEGNLRYQETAVKNQPSFSFPKENHLTRQRDFRTVYEQGHWFRGRFISIIIFVSDENLFLKAGFSIRKKIYKRAVDRNKIKRRFREIIRLSKKNLSRNVWLVFHARPNTLKASYKDLTKDFELLCKKADILLNRSVF